MHRGGASRSRILYHMVRADFLERTRRYSFLLTLAFAVYLGYAVYAGQVNLRLNDYRGINNSAWVGTVIALVATTWLTLIGFYIVKNTIQRDRETRVGRILATTPMSRSFYTLSKALSNFAVLGSMIFVLAVCAIIIQLLHGEVRHIDLVKLLAPVLLFGLCGMAVTAALAVLFETIPLLRGGVGNILYFFLWIALLIAGVGGMDHLGAASATRSFGDYTGMATLMGQMQRRLHALDPLYSGGASFSVGDHALAKKTFLWTGMEWNTSLLLSRGMWLGIAILLALVAAILFDRFDPAREIRFIGKKQSVPITDARAEAATATNAHFSASQLTPIAKGAARSRIFSLAVAELKLMLQGQPWWWYAVAAGLFVGCLASPLAASRSGVILMAWLWPALLWSQMGTREARFETGRLIYSAQRAFPRQMLAMWLAGVALALLTGGGLGIRLLMARDFAGLAAWLTGALFIPSLALALGVCTESRKPFEAIYIAWWYVGPLHHLPRADFMGTTPQSSTPVFFLVFLAVLLIIAFSWRRARLSLA
jgi:ABC-2 family transporter protein